MGIYFSTRFIIQKSRPGTMGPFVVRDAFEHGRTLLEAGHKN
jgi:hypothetical protein